MGGSDRCRAAISPNSPLYAGFHTTFIPKIQLQISPFKILTAVTKKSGQKIIFTSNSLISPTSDRSTWGHGTGSFQWTSVSMAFYCARRFHQRSQHTQCCKCWSIHWTIVPLPPLNVWHRGHEVEGQWVVMAMWKNDGAEGQKECNLVVCQLEYVE